MWRNVLIGGKSQIWICGYFHFEGWYGYHKTLYKIIHNSRHSQFTHWQLLKYADDCPPVKQVLAYCSQFVHRFINSGLITTVPASVHTTWHPLLIWAKKVNLRDFIFSAAAALCDSVTSRNSDAPTCWSPTCSLSFQWALNQLCAFFDVTYRPVTQHYTVYVTASNWMMTRLW